MPDRQRVREPTSSPPQPAVSAPPALPADVVALQQRLDELETQCADLQKLMAESQRLATIGTIAAVIAHEFNNLLTPVVSYSQYALKSLKSPAPDMVMIEKALTKAAAGGE